MHTKSILGLVSMLAMVAACSGSTPTGIDPPAGSTGPVGSVGAPGSGGEQGPAGDSGTPGPIACGDSLIPQDVWHTACNVRPSDSSGVASVCSAGIVECRLTATTTDGGTEVVPSVMCWDTVKDAAAGMPTNTSGLCYVDSSCTGTPDNTVGDGTKVTLIRPALTYLSDWQDSQSDSGVVTYKKGLCENAVEHCLGTTGGEGSLVLQTVASDAGTVSVQVSCDGFGRPVANASTLNGEGVVLADFVADPKESLMGAECADSTGTVRLWACSVDANNTASVTCSGPTQ